MNLFQKQYTIRVFLASICLAISCLNYAQTRYLDPVFGVGVTYNIAYDTSKTIQGHNQVLLLDIYQPLDDSLKKRPLIVFAHGGGFVMGNKNNYPMETICSRFAQMGYVCASINYGQGFQKIKDPNEASSITVQNAASDMAKALTFLKGSANRQFGIDPTIIWVGGSSSGAITALHLAFKYEQQHKISGVISLSGAIGDTSWITKNIPVVSIHGTEDKIVPYKDGEVNFRFPFIEKVPRSTVHGSYDIHNHLSKLGFTNRLIAFSNTGHCPFDKVLERKQYTLYMDSSINVVRDFMYNAQWNNSDTVVRDVFSRHTTLTSIEFEGASIWFYPVDKTIKKIKVEMYEYEPNHRKVTKRIKKQEKAFQWQLDKLPTKFELQVWYGKYSRYWIKGDYYSP
jgi:predicted esterase